LAAAVLKMLMVVTHLLGQYLRLLAADLGDKVITLVHHLANLVIQAVLVVVLQKILMLLVVLVHQDKALQEVQ
jgi:hypothetical protein